MTEVALVTDEYRAVGFKLANISNVYTVESNIETLKIVESLLKEDFGIILITSNIAPPDESQFVEYLKQSYPSIIVLPTGTGDVEPDRMKNIEELIQQSVGFSVKL